MKKMVFILLAAMLLLTGCTTTTPEKTQEKSNDLLTLFTEDKYQFKSATLDAFSEKAEDAPTDEELKTMLNFAMASASAHGLTPAHFIVIRDVEEQRDITSGIEAFGMESPCSDGTVTILVLADTLRDQDVHDDEYNGWYSQMYYGIYDAGASCAYFTLAAQSMGYAIHQLAGLNIPTVELGGVNVFAAGGNMDLVRRQYWDVSKYMTSKDGSVDFTHFVAHGTMQGESLEVSAYNNLTLLSTIVVGKRKDDIDVQSSATTAYPDDLANYNFWDPQDGTSYGNSKPAGEKTELNISAFTLENVEDGTYSASAESHSSKYTVEVTVENGKITKIEITEGLENMFAGEETVNEYINTIIETQNIEPDVISGATQDCTGISSALKEALSE